MSTEFQANMVALRTIVHREVRRFTRIWAQTLLPPAITMVLYFVIFGILIGNRIGIKPLFTLIAMYVGVNLFSIAGFVLGPIGLIIIITVLKVMNEKSEAESHPTPEI